MAVLWKDVSILNNTAISEDLRLGPNQRVVGILVPGTWTAADIGFAVSRDGTTFVRVVDPARTTAATSHARVVNVETGASEYYIVSEALDLPVGVNVKLTSINVASNADVNQGGDRALQVAVSDR